jgi:hypothetical protein
MGGDVVSRASVRTGLAEQLLVAWVRSGKHHLVHDSALNAGLVRGAYDLAETFCVETEQRAEPGALPSKPSKNACTCPRTPGIHEHVEGFCL